MNLKFKSTFSKFDFFNKIEGKALKPSPLGGLVTWIGITLLLFLFIFELSNFLQQEFIEVVSVDPSQKDTILIFLDISFPNTGCKEIKFFASNKEGIFSMNSYFKMKWIPYQKKDENVVYCFADCWSEGISLSSSF